MKKLMSLLIASTVAASSLVPVFAADTFKDVNEKSYSWAYSYVEDMAERGLIKGYDDGTFRPGNSVSRMDAFALFARLVGSNSEVNAGVLEKAKENYSEVLSEYGLSYAEGDVAFMLSRGIIKEDELDTYFKGDKKTQPMPRYEAAILITKAMLGEQDAKNEVLVDMDYTDVSSIPKAAKQYVYYVTKNEIMSGVGNGEFSPNTDVKRGQIAVMLSKTADAVDYAFEDITIVKVNEEVMDMTLRDADGKDVKIGYNKDTKFFEDGKEIAVSALKSGQKAVLTYVTTEEGTRLAFADVEKSYVDSKKSFLFKSHTSISGEKTISVLDPDTEMIQNYICSPSAVITADGRSINIGNIKEGNYVTIGFSGDKVVEIDAMQKSTLFDAVIEKMNSSRTITISSNNAEFDGMTLTISSDVLVTKNSDTASLSALGRGDKVKINLESGIVTRINASGITTTITGVFKGYTVLASETPSIIISRDGKDYTYDIPASAEITINGEKAKISDIVVGSSVTVTVESEVVKKIVASNASGSLNSTKVIGTVTNVYETYISLNPENGGDAEITLACDKHTKVYSAPRLGDYAFNKIKAGDTVEAYGEYVNSAFFTAAGLIVTPKTE